MFSSSRVTVFKKMSKIAIYFVFCVRDDLPQTPHVIKRIIGQAKDTKSREFSSVDDLGIIRLPMF